MTDPDVTPGRQQLTARGVVHEGRVAQRTASCVVLVVWVMLTLLVVLDLFLAGGLRGARWMWLPAVAAVLQGLVCLVRHRVVEGASGAHERRRIVRDVPPDPLTGLVVACSGGGVKSSAFCLGGLQRLDEAGVLGRAREIVGVSGGGYVAGAYASVRNRRTAAGMSGAVLAPDSPEVRVLRARSDYISNSHRVRGSLTGAVLLGTALHVLILLAVVRVAGRLLAEHVVLTQARGDRPWGRDGLWLYDVASPTIWVPPAVLVVVSLLLFMGGGGVEPTRRAGRGRWSAWLVQPGRRGYLTAWFVASLPTMLLAAAVAWLLVCGLGVWAATGFHNQLLERQGGLLEGLTAVLGSMAAGLVAVTGLVRSTAKGATAAGADWGAVRGADEQMRWVASLMGRVRRHFAPVAGTVLLVAVLYAALVGVVTLDVWALLGGSHTGAIAVLLGPLPGPGSIPESGPPAFWWVVTGPVVALGFLAVLRSVHPAHRTSLVPFYRDRLSFAYLEIPAGGEDPSLTSDPATRRTAGPPRAPALADLGDEGPAVRLCATANVKDAHLLPAGRGAAPITFSTAATGFTDGHLPGGACTPKAATYPGGISLADSLAASAGAIAPLAGRDNTLVRSARILLALANIRLGLWLPNPYWVQAGAFTESRPSVRIARLLDRTSPLHVLREAVGVPSVFHPWVFVTDGGHYDNLGLVEALRLRPETIVVLDGSGDPEDQFTAMGLATATARIDLGVEIDFDPTDITRGDQPRATAGFVTCDATYPDGGICRIVYVKSVWASGFRWDVEAYRSTHPGFPALSDELESYGEFDLEAFRQLGWCYVGAALMTSGNESL